MKYVEKVNGKKFSLADIAGSFMNGCRQGLTVIMAIIFSLTLAACSDEKQEQPEVTKTAETSEKKPSERLIKKPRKEKQAAPVNSVRAVNGNYSVNKKTKELTYHVSFQLGKPFESDMNAILEYNHPESGEKLTLNQKIPAKVERIEFKLDDMNCLKKGGDYPLNLRLFSEDNKEVETTKINSAITNFMPDATLQMLGVSCNV